MIIVSSIAQWLGHRFPYSFPGFKVRLVNFVLSCPALTVSKNSTWLGSVLKKLKIDLWKSNWSLNVTLMGQKKCNVEIAGPLCQLNHFSYLYLKPFSNTSRQRVNGDLLAPMQWLTKLNHFMTSRYYISWWSGGGCHRTTSPPLNNFTHYARIGTFICFSPPCSQVILSSTRCFGWTRSSSHFPRTFV